jgi:hypothetical protein
LYHQSRRSSATCAASELQVDVAAISIIMPGYTKVYGTATPTPQIVSDVTNYE